MSENHVNGIMARATARNETSVTGSSSLDVFIASLTDTESDESSRPTSVEASVDRMVNAFGDRQGWLLTHERNVGDNNALHSTIMSRVNQIKSVRASMLTDLKIRDYLIEAQFTISERLSANHAEWIDHYDRIRLAFRQIPRQLNFARMLHHEYEMACPHWVMFWDIVEGNTEETEGGGRGGMRMKIILRQIADSWRRYSFLHQQLRKPEAKAVLEILFEEEPEWLYWTDIGGCE